MLAANAYFNSCVQPSGSNLDNEVIFAKFAIDGSNISSRMKPFTKALVNFAYVNARNDTSFFDAEWSNCVAALDVKVDSPGQLKCVFDYLCSVCVQRCLIDKISRNRLDDFENYFVHENMFTPDFYEKISNCEVQ